MNNFLIYENDNCKIEIDGFFHELAKRLFTPFFRLSDATYNMLLSHIANRIMEEYPDHKTDVIVGSTKVYILHYKQYLEFDEPFGFFDTAVEYIVDQEDFNNNKQRITKDIEDIYDNENNFFVEIFPFDIFKVCGYFGYMKDGHIYVLFFSHEQR